MNDRCLGVVLSAADYRDNDILYTVFSKEYGYLSLVGKAAKKLVAKNRLRVFSLYEFILDYKEGKSIFTLHNAKLLEAFGKEDDLKDLAYHNIYTELLSRNRELIGRKEYDELLFAWRELSKTNARLLLCLFLSSLLIKQGLTPYADGCVVCGNSKVSALSFRQGGFLCEEHRRGENPIDPLRLKKFRLVVKGGFEHYDYLSAFDYDDQDLNYFVRFYEENNDTLLSSYKFYATV